jgi:hypothetical protein
LTRKEWAYVLELYRYCAENDHKEQCYVIEKLWKDCSFDFVYSPIDLTFILSHRKNLEELGLVALEAMQPLPNKSLPDSEAKRLEGLINYTKVYILINLILPL